MQSINGIALLGAALAALTAWQAHRTVKSGGSFYDREVYGMTAALHRRVFIAAASTTIICVVAAAIPGVPITPFVALETVAVILYLASFARGASHEDEP